MRLAHLHDHRTDVSHSKSACTAHQRAEYPPVEDMERRAVQPLGGNGAGVGAAAGRVSCGTNGTTAAHLSWLTPQESLDPARSATPFPPLREPSSSAYLGLRRASSHARRSVCWCHRKALYVLVRQHILFAPQRVAGLPADRHLLLQFFLHYLGSDVQPQTWQRRH